MLKYFPLGDSAFLIKAGNDISLNTHLKIKSITDKIKDENIDGIIELTPAYNEILVSYNPLKINYVGLLEKIKSIAEDLIITEITKPDLIYIPVCYESEFSPDIEIVAERNNLTAKEVIQIHCSVDYLVYMLGFTPGFCYLGGMSEQITTPRKENPRNKIEAGSVGIAGNQTGIYPVDSPGGWQLIGKTPLKLFDPERNPEFLIEAGNYIRFAPVSKVEYDKILAEVANNEYRLKKERGNG
ncbi:MAG: 5-oxoprolinase subunit PxpB [Bacteroidales bacterium]|nr:5-oxoprolinase subunit PxpB [Bacteroidales bacterium]